jgi:hypothetical protein
MQESQKKESDKNLKKKESGKIVKRTQNQARTQEYKNLAWWDFSWLARQDSVYKNTTRRSRSVFFRQESCIEGIAKES